MLDVMKYRIDRSELDRPYGDRVFTIVEQKPVFPGGLKALSQFVSFNLNYPEKARENKISGTVFVEFVIAPDGSVVDVKTEKGIGYDCDEAAEQAISKLPDREPGYQRGRPVPVKMVLPISFK